MNRRLLGNLLVIIFLILSISGFLLYFLPFQKNIASIHTFFALFFTLGVIFHIINNKKALTNYITGKRVSSFKKLQSFFITILSFILILGLYYKLPLISELYNYGNRIRNKQIGKKEKDNNYQIIDLPNAIGSKNVLIELKKGKSFQYPLFAIWLEDLKGNYIKTLYVSRVIASSSFDYGIKIKNKWKPAIVRRPESLPVWSHKRGIIEQDSLYIPLHNTSDLDAYSGATPTGNFIINSKTHFKKNTGYKVFLELNQSYDWNDYYTKNKFPNDAIYTGSGKVGQPSLIYAITINKIDFSSKVNYLMDLIGHGHHSGNNGNLYSDLSNITTAKDIASRIIISIQ